jgi:hypothetical protein
MATNATQKQIRHKQRTKVSELHQTQPDYRRFNQKFNIILSCLPRDGWSRNYRGCRGIELSR